MSCFLSCSFVGPLRLLERAGALVFLLALFSPLCLAGGPAPLTLKEAISRSLAHHPSMQVYPLRSSALKAEREIAELGPPLEASLEVENVLGSGEFSGFDAAEVALSFSSVVELGGKRIARQALVAGRVDHLATQRQSDALKLLGDVTRRYIDLLVAQAEQALVNDAALLAQKAVKAVRRRVLVGASPEAELLRAQAVLAQTEMDVAQTQRAIQQARFALSVLWGVTNPQFERVEGSLFELGPRGDLANLYQRALKNPSMQALITEKRLREAELRLARSAARLDIRWSLGARRSSDTEDMALVAGLSAPLFSRQRHQGATRVAALRSEEVTIRQKHADHQLYALLFDAFSQRQTAIAGKQSLQNRVIPLLEQAAQATEKAYDRGRYSYMEWAVAQQELLAARQSLIQFSAAAHIHRVEIEQLTAEPLEIR